MWFQIKFRFLTNIEHVWHLLGGGLAVGMWLGETIAKKFTLMFTLDKY